MFEPTFLLADENIVIVAMVGGILIAIISIVGGFVRRLHAESVRGRTQREIAAYVAEGSMTPDEGERLMKAATEPIKDPDA